MQKKFNFFHAILKNKLQSHMLSHQQRRNISEKILMSKTFKASSCATANQNANIMKKCSIWNEE